MQPNEDHLLKLAREVKQQADDAERSVREAIAAAVDEGRDLIRDLTPVPIPERGAWLQQHFAGTRKLASLLIRLAMDPPGPDVPVEELIPFVIALFCENHK